MKTVLVATDFSRASHTAAQYGLEMANAFNGKVVLFNAYQQIPITLVDTVIILNTDDWKLAVQEQLEEEADRVTGEEVVPIELLSKEGPSVEAILEAAGETKADLIVAGMKGGGNALRRMVGSTATVLALKTTIPLLIIPEGLSFSRLNTIALATNITPDADPHLLDALRIIVERFHPRVYIVRVVRRQLDQVVEVVNWSHSVDGKVKDLNPVYEFPFGKNVSQALSDFISSHNIDMLAMIPHHHSLLEKISHPSVTKGVLFRAKIPVLIVPDHRYLQ